MIEVVDDELPRLGLSPNLLLWPPSEWFEDHNGGLGFLTNWVGTRVDPWQEGTNNPLQLGSF
jgi:hypothetical protein